MAAARNSRLRLVETSPDPVEAPEPRALLRVGAALREERERRGWNVPELAQHLKIRRVHLEAIEAGRFAALPGPTYAVKFVRAYADALGLDPEEMIRRFRDEVEGLDRRVELNFPQPLSESRLPAGIVVLVSVVIAGLGYAAWTQFNQGARVALPRVEAVPQVLAERLPPPPPLPPAPETPPVSIQPAPATATPATEPPAQTTVPPNLVAPAPVAPPPAPVAAAPAASEPPPAAPAVVAPILSTPAAPAVVAPIPSTPAAPAVVAPIPSTPPSVAAVDAAPPPATPAPADPAAPRGFGDIGGGGRIVVHAQSDSWVQVREPGGNVIFMRILRSGETYQPPPRTDLLLTTGSAGALDIRVDGKSAPSIGRVGYVKRDVALDPPRLLAGTAAPPDPPLRPAPAASPVPAAPPAAPTPAAGGG